MFDDLKALTERVSPLRSGSALSTTSPGRST